MESERESAVRRGCVWFRFRVASPRGPALSCLIPVIQPRGNGVVQRSVWVAPRNGDKGIGSGRNRWRPRRDDRGERKRDSGECHRWRKVVRDA